MTTLRATPELFREAEAKMNSLLPFSPIRPVKPCHPLDKWSKEDKDPEENSHQIALAIFGWRRDYGEWPSWHNTVDRLAVELRISHKAAARRLAFALNDPSERSTIYALHSSDVERVLGGSEPKAKLDFWMAAELTLYIPADFITIGRDVMYKLARNGIQAA
jgi:hypothetical protein